MIKKLYKQNQIEENLYNLNVNKSSSVDNKHVEKTKPT